MAAAGRRRRRRRRRKKKRQQQQQQQQRRVPSEEEGGGGPRSGMTAAAAAAASGSPLPLPPLPPAAPSLSVWVSEAPGGASGYSRGQTVTGLVVLELPAPLPLRALLLQAHGRARAAWSEGPTASASSASAPPPPPPPPPPPQTGTGTGAGPREAEVVYLDLRQRLLGHGGNRPEGDDSLILLEAGKHEFPFSFQLPQKPLATSFTGKYGSIQYCVKATLERPVAPSQTVKREFQVISHIDVNSPVLLSPVRRCQEKMVGCWVFTSGPVSLSAKIERKGYCNGEAIPIYAEIENCSSRLIVPKAAIFQTQTYLASGKTKTFRQMVANVRGNHVASGSTDTWNGKTLKIPPVTPSILDCCIIRVDYSLAVYIHIPGAKKLMLELPLVIGTIPCTAFSSRNSSLVSQFNMDMSWLALAMPEHPEAPPSYADVVSEEEFSRHVTAFPRALDCEEQLCCPMFAFIQEFQFQPPPLYSEIDPHPSEVEDNQPVSFMA